MRPGHAGRVGTDPSRRARTRTGPRRLRHERRTLAKSRDHRRTREAAWSRADAAALLEAPERREKQDPERLWEKVGLREGDVVVDVGAGSGFFSFPAARRVGPAGRVYAVDVSEELVGLLRERATSRKAGNVAPVLSTPTHIPIEDAVADVAILANVLHGIPPETVDEAVRLLRPGGRLVNLDWKKQRTEGGPPVRHRLTAEEATRTLAAHGMTPVDSFDLGPDHYVLVFERPRLPHHPGHLVSAE